MSEMNVLLRQAVEKRLLRPLDIQFARLIADDAQPFLLLAAACVSADAGEGHVCLPLANLSEAGLFAGRQPALARALWQAAGAPDDVHAALAGWSAISDGSAVTPLVLSHERLYLHRLWQSEGQVARFFSLQPDEGTFDAHRASEVLTSLFGSRPDDWQKIAAAVALTRKTAVISGGPGTGKTTTVAKLLAALIRLNTVPLRIQLAAPTGKAAARLTESLGKALQGLAVSEEERARFPAEATTLHRLLGAQPDTQRLRYHAGNLLHLDVLVVDEASMVDLSMMAKLISALPHHARVVFLGDRDQLASVEAGAVLGDICRCSETGFSPSRAAQLTALTGCTLTGDDVEAAPAVRDSICLLRQSYRFDEKSGIGQLARAVNQGDARQMSAIFAAGHQDVSFRPLNDGDAYQAMLDEVARGYSDYLHAVQHQATPEQVIDGFSRYQLLCALREGPFGVHGLNQRIEQRLMQLQRIRRPALGSRWYAGRPVMITRNDSALGLFNGDIGITLRDEEGQLRVFFPLPDGSVKAIQPSRLPSHETAWVMTVHKSQGSEFDHTALVMPTQFLPVLTRELVYTAITRARSQLTLYSDRAIFDRAVQLQTQRRSGLVERLGAAGQA
ncbi:exodeoxyribonuclease V subunit alpha [Pantoea ananatis]|uniref:exodeoxyribonuclease V subunit alpha n=1 Tax=Pantoea ananas TaxID=553 RepID=UPI0021E9AAE7|nr:exodeoxyribonuclease V subunit alpha [Pantoea ananatis]MCW0307268.1 RecBCD enzyme subunit RecD [Pantoea ananatis]MCW0339267.1 RecBCD enzyme subunit RecD [Pantoea ananatis]MCW0357461.1 RecBCD enzyme subunit RecD [Pantoea ananatis]MCW0362084.1 RecBCD enzyme subunit RecD [Pantoea ananatis]MCW1774874.1 exodeoxyribonuclease V subunit alpha [Pantoea ananatis]